MPIDACGSCRHCSTPHWRRTGAEARKAADTIAELEQEADRRKAEIRLHLSTCLWMPVPRTDLLALLFEQDTMANHTRDVARLVVERRMQIPAMVADKLTGFVGRCVRTARQARKCVQWSMKSGAWKPKPTTPM